MMTPETARVKGFQTKKSLEIDRVVGLEIGADDYVSKPFGLRELLARIRVQLRRRAPTAESPSTVRFADIEVDLQRQEAQRAGRRVDLTGKEFEVLRLLVGHRGEIVTREQLLDEVWGYETYPTTRTVDNHILRLRQKLEPDPSNPRHFLSIYGEGYKGRGHERRTAATTTQGPAGLPPHRSHLRSLKMGS